jgi:hypothetical protein
MAIYLIDSLSICTGPVELPVIPGLGAQLPGNAIEIESPLAPPQSGHVWIWEDAAAVQIADHRGVAYHKETGKEERWVELGELPEWLTLEPRPGPHYVWRPDGWELDEKAEQAAMITRCLAVRDGFLYEAGLRIAPLQDAVDLNKATPEEQSTLLLWKDYRIDLNRIEDQEGFPSDIEWPTAPESRKYH